MLQEHNNSLVLFFCAGGAVNLESIADVDEGNPFNVCVNLVGSANTLGYPLTVSLNVIDNTKTGLCVHQYCQVQIL